MEESGNFLCVAGEQPQKGVREMRFGTEGKTGTERSGKRTEDTGSSSHSSPCSPAPPPFAGLPRIRRQEPAPRKPLPVWPAPQCRDWLPDGHLGDAVPHCPGNAAQRNRVGSRRHRGISRGEGRSLTTHPATEEGQGLGHGGTTTAAAPGNLLASPSGPTPDPGIRNSGGGEPASGLLQPRRSTKC